MGRRSGAPGEGGSRMGALGAFMAHSLARSPGVHLGWGCWNGIKPTAHGIGQGRAGRGTAAPLQPQHSGTAVSLIPRGCVHPVLQGLQLELSALHGPRSDTNPI